MTTEVIKIEGMMCGHCQANVEKSVGSVTGVSEVKVDLAAKQATVTFDPDIVSLDAIKAVVTDAGYTVVA
ncbi:MAG: copper chaperone [Methanolobus sp.]|jgi:copper ion binding protein|uniref:Copper ion binding protein n=1 Tax=Methanolobus tindarius DSM 2278 TaxID=1090322 RepID=W9DRV3_METTI|nr:MULTISPECIES: copper ion binding protein [Methanolobus]ETA68498.1 copper ion binding protein [Methanolobus tindarius DSM 2278]MDI3485218.1 copper chaperone [Methanolobus sp.]MDK2831696.1 copper chaperone [Methanolobus sp.]MDK2938997.1 copper chaperone [Methanolobus sp.]